MNFATRFLWTPCLLFSLHGMTSAAVGDPLPGSNPANLSNKVHPFTLKAPTFTFEGLSSGDVGGSEPTSIKAGDTIELTYPPAELPGGGKLEIETSLQWSAKESLWRKWARYRVSGTSRPLVATRVRLERIELKAPDQAWTGAIPPAVASGAGATITAAAGNFASRPVFSTGHFVGIEFPIAGTSLDHNVIDLDTLPGITLVPGEWHETRRAVCGHCPAGREVQSFEDYITQHRPPPSGLHMNFNSWWTTPVPFSQEDVLKLMSTFEEKLFRPYHVSFDSFSLDLGWSDTHSIWQVDGKRFPRGLTPVVQAAEQMGAHVGLWLSPSSCYSGLPGAPDPRWALDQGYEFFSQHPPTTSPTSGTQPSSQPDKVQKYGCLAGPRYRAALQSAFVDHIKQYGISQLKLDGYVPTCPEWNHGHLPGPLSADKIAEGAIEAIRGIREVAPNIWLESTCFGWNPSPWWLFHVNSVIGTFGDDAPSGRVPAPVYRESYTTARDYFNLQGSALLPIPIAAQEVLGIVHQSPDSFMNDGVVTMMRGNQFISAYLNPRFMDDNRWRMFAGLIQWARAHADLLARTEPLLPVSWQNGKVPQFTDSDRMPREPYGYAHWNAGRGLVLLRNPWMKPTKYKLQIGVDAAHAAKSRAVSVYPELRNYGAPAADGASIDIPLAPYETLVLSISRDALAADLPLWNRHRVSGEIQTAAFKHELRFVQYEKPEHGATGPDYTLLVNPDLPAHELRLSGKVSLASNITSDLYILIEMPSRVPQPYCHLAIDNKEVQPAFQSSATGWSATQLNAPEHWMFVTAPLPGGSHEINATLVLTGDHVRASAWILGSRKPLTTLAESSEMLPGPERLMTHAVALLEPTELNAGKDKPVQLKPLVEKIEGVYLDTLQPESATQGWGTLQRNTSVAGHPLSIGGKTYRRGLGTHAPGNLRFNLDGSYRRFQSWAGLDGAATGTITLEVLVDGKPAWHSEIIRAGDSAQRIDLDVAHAKTLELNVTDGGDNFVSDHADWADAVLLH